LNSKFHIALSVADLDASITDYSLRLGCSPCVVVPHEYALWRTDTLNFSIRETAEAGDKLRHLGWEDSTAESFTQDTDVNGIPWERFAASQQQAEIESLWPGVTG
jgi:hypothetical protein